MICQSCKIQLEKFYTFKKKCESSDVKLRRHIKLIQEKICKNDQDNSEIKINVNDVLSDLMNDDSNDEATAKSTEEITEMTNEEDLVGAKVAYLEPDLDQQEEADPENITLPVESEETITKEACTLKTINLKKEIVDDQEEELMEEVEQSELFIIPGMEQEQEQEAEEEEEEETVIEQDDQFVDDNDFAAIAEAVKGTLSTLPGFNVNGQLQIQLDTKPGKPTQVQVTTEDGSVIVMELMTTDDNVEIPIIPEQDEDGELKVFQVFIKVSDNLGQNFQIFLF